MSKYQSLIDSLDADEFLTSTVAKFEVRALLADLERAEKDAERYRWLRDTNNAEGLRIFNAPAACQDAEWLDAAIDAALAQMAGGG